MLTLKNYMQERINTKTQIPQNEETIFVARKLRTENNTLFFIIIIFSFSKFFFVFISFNFFDVCNYIWCIQAYNLFIFIIFLLFFLFCLSIPTHLFRKLCIVILFAIVSRWINGKLCTRMSPVHHSIIR